MNDNDDELDYVSSVDPFTPEKTDPSVNAPDERVLETLSKILAKQKALYATINGMKQFDQKKFNADQREALATKFVELVESLEKTVNNAIKGVKEKQGDATER